MAEEQQGQEKTEAPTPKKRQDTRKEGQVAMSREVASAALLATFTLFFLVLGQTVFMQVQAFWRHQFNNLARPDLNMAQIQQGFGAALATFGPLVLGLFALAMAVAFLAMALQVGLMLTPMKFQGQRLNPLRGLQRIFSRDGFMELFKSLFKMSVVGYVTYLTLAQEASDLLTISRLPVAGIAAYNFNLLFTLFGRVALAMVMLAILDYMFQRWSHEQRIKMTRQEVKDELKQTEGDPTLRSRVRQIQREMSRARMMEAVPEADVVVTNPTHYAVALAYDREVMTAPRVVAKGADYLAERIKAVASDNDVPIVENAVVARELHAQVEIGQEVPEHFFRSVAEILAYVYRLRRRGPAAARAS